VVDVHRQVSLGGGGVFSQGALTRGGVCGCSGESSLLGAVEKATAEAEKHGDRSSEKLSALVAEARTMIEQAKTEQAERAGAAAAAAEAAAAVKAAAAAERARVAAEAEAVEAAERLKMEQELAALTLRMETRRNEGAADALRAQQMQARLGNSVAPHAGLVPDAEETMCVVCFDAPKDHIIIPCGHQCVCGTCAEALKREAHPACPLCREPISVTAKVFLS
jgi:hypothetical protein